jgi:hypothetical protein
MYDKLAGLAQGRPEEESQIEEHQFIGMRWA